MVSLISVWLYFYGRLLVSPICMEWGCNQIECSVQFLRNKGNSLGYTIQYDLLSGECYDTYGGGVTGGGGDGINLSQPNGSKVNGIEGRVYPRTLMVLIWSLSPYLRSILTEGGYEGDIIYSTHGGVIRQVVCDVRAINPVFGFPRRVFDYSVEFGWFGYFNVMGVIVMMTAFCLLPFTLYSRTTP